MFVNESHVLLSPVETDPPRNLTYIMLNESIGEVGYSILVSWLHPIEPQVHESFIMLYELRYRNLTQADNWRVQTQRVCLSCLYFYDNCITDRNGDKHFVVYLSEGNGAFARALCGVF